LSLTISLLLKLQVTVAVMEAVMTIAVAEGDTIITAVAEVGSDFSECFVCELGRWVIYFRADV
jgi:hypothetical protein